MSHAQLWPLSRHNLVTDVTIEAMGARGDGVARIDGAPVYIPLVLPGELVRVSIEGERGRLVKVLQASPDRTDPPCSHFGSCGGLFARTAVSCLPCHGRLLRCGETRTHSRFKGLKRR